MRRRSWPKRSWRCRCWPWRKGASKQSRTESWTCRRGTTTERAEAVAEPAKHWTEPASGIWFPGIRGRGAAPAFFFLPFPAFPLCAQGSAAHWPGWRGTWAIPMLGLCGGRVGRCHGWATVAR